MISWKHRLTSLAAVFALAGVPAVHAACVAFCLESSVAAVTQAGQSHAGHGADLASAAPTVTVHAHHEAAASTRSAEEAPAISSGPLFDVGLASPCSDCCSNQQSVSAVGINVDRSGRTPPGAAPPVDEASFYPPVATYPLSSASLLTPPPIPARAPLALRI